MSAANENDTERGLAFLGDYLDRHPAQRCAVRLFRRYLDHHVARDAAALTYYLLFALFPLLIFINNVVGLLEIDIHSLIRGLPGLVPQDVLGVADQYIQYVARVSNRRLMWFSLVFSIYFPYRAVNALFLSVRKAYGVPAPVHFLRDQLRMLFFTLVLIVALSAAALTSTVGSRALAFVSRYVYLSESLVHLWTSSRFVVLGGILFGVIALLYALAVGSGRERRGVWPGVLVALLMWIILSVGFSLYVEHAANYSIIYGSIGAVIVLLLWLYLSAVMLIMGAELNSVLLGSRKDRKNGT